MHCDVLGKACSKRKKDIYRFPKAMVDIERLKEGQCMMQFLAIFMPPIEFKKVMGPFFPKDRKYIEKVLKIYQETICKYSDELIPVSNVDDLQAETSKVKTLLTLEDGRYVNGDMKKLEELYEMGVRLISLTWNAPNCFGMPNSRDEKVMNEGLSDFGREAILRMNELGIAIDVSHLSDGGFYDVANISKKPFVASHSNCRTLCSHQRNLTDEMIKIIAEKGGVIGVNFAPDFVLDNNKARITTMEMIARHLRHMIRMGGVECAAIGTDFDGISGNLEISHAGMMSKLFEYLSIHGFSANEIEHIAYKNVLRAMKDIL